MIGERRSELTTADSWVMHVSREGDVQVTKEDAKQAMNEQYGGQDEPSTGFNSTYRAAAKFSNAYMLVYIRESDWNTVMCDVIPCFLRQQILLGAEAT